ncbi:hypothetical protein HDK90DRAFT_110363 [Phyllosticta capitalensis]|uniref:Uncharacterized protein n=1 Tax=Phyllosticta capitalensis TaxID=121624 RepID=A0ABR1YAL3_9PEZI
MAPVTSSSSKALRKSTARSSAPLKAAHTPSPYEIMAARISNRIAELAENYTFVERPQILPQPQHEPATGSSGRKQPRKLEIRLPSTSPDGVSFSAPFLDNTLSKMLALQERMLKIGIDLAKNEEVSEEVKREQFAQSAELSKIIALICAEKARQGA